jgi:predicted transcriptional regulator
MRPKLTAEQRAALKECDGPVLVEDEQTNRVYYLVDEPTFTSLKQQEDLAAIREGIADMEAGRIVTLEELDTRIRCRLGLEASE